jgi:head-tail adaptor
MARLGLGAGRYNKWVTLSHAPQNATDGIFDPLDPEGAWVALRPTLAANGRVTEHVVEMRYHPQVTVDTRIIYEDPSKPVGKTTRALYVRAVQDLEEANDVMRLICEEIAP